MFINVFEDSKEWWDYYWENDKTILSTSSENLSSNFSKIIFFENNNFLFKSSGFTWSYGKKEKTFLEDLAQKQKEPKSLQPTAESGG